MKSQADSESVSESAAQSTRQSKITEARVSVMSKTQRDTITKDLVRNMVFEDKEPFSVFERPGFRKCIERLNPAKDPPNRVTVAAVADEIAEECLTDVRSILVKHVADGGTICLAADAWTKKRKLVDKSNDLYEKVMRVGVLDCNNGAGEFKYLFLC